ncbi:MAG: rhamnan synthesis F family protein [Lachnospiraceae bacterium]
MIIDNEKAKRLAIYFFYDKNGIVDKYVPYFLDDLKKNINEIFIVCNGNLNQAGQEELKKYGEVFVRENKGLDVWAYKTALQQFGWEKLETYEEIILMNSTIMGPIYPLLETFEKMAVKDLDFWGLTKYFKIDGDPFGCSPYGYLPDHIQSHFIACRKSLIQSKEFQKYWDDMPMINNYSEAIGKHEAVFTKYFGDLGYQWDVSVETEDLRSYSGYPLMMCPEKIIKERRCPIFKRRSFFHTINDYLRNTTGEQTSELYEYLRRETQYDVNLIWDTILRNYHQSDIVKNMNLTYILPTNKMDAEHFKKILKENKVALVMHIYFEDLLEESYRYVSSMPKEADIYITTDTKQKKEAIEKKFEKLICNKLQVILIQNRGRDVSSLLVGVKDVIMNYDFVCFVHDKKTAQVSPGTVGASFAYKCFENTLSSKAYVANVIETFADNPRLGLLTSPEPNHGPFFPTIGCEWGPNYDVTVKLAQQLGLTVPMSVSKQPIAPFGTMFWFRTKAMKILYQANWKYEDFPEEPNKIDGSLLHAIERIYPFVVQEEGYYPAIGMTDKFAAIEYNNLRYYVRGYNQVLLNNGIGPYQDEMCIQMADHFNMQGSSFSVLKWQIKKMLKRILPNCVYKGGGKIKRFIHK